MYKEVDEEEDDPEEERPEERLVPVEEVARARVPRGWGHGDEGGVAGGKVVRVGVAGVHVGVVVGGGDGGGVVGVVGSRRGRWSTVVALGGVGIGGHGCW